MEKVEKKKIGILDMGIGGLPILNNLNNILKGDDLIYVNDLTVTTYEGMNVDEINERVKINIDFLISQKINCLLIVSDTIIEYCLDLIKSYQIPYFQIVQEIIDYVNENYEYKNMAFLACNDIISANIYQKNFRYNHLYTLAADEINIITGEGKMKTSESFLAVKNCLAPIFRKDVDLLIPSMIHFLMLRTEIVEFLKDIDIVNVDEILTEKVVGYLYNKNPLPNKGKGGVHIYLHKRISDKILNKYLQIKYKIYIQEGGKESGKK